MKTTFMNFEIKAVYTGSKKWGATSGAHENWNHHRVTVKNLNTGKSTWFDFWESIAAVEIKDRKGLLNALYCFASDADSGAEDFEDFCSSFGYDTDSRTAEKTWKACQKANEKAERIGLDSEMRYAIRDVVDSGYLEYKCHACGHMFVAENLDGMDRCPECSVHLTGADNIVPAYEG